MKKNIFFDKKIDSNITKKSLLPAGRRQIPRN